MILCKISLVIGSSVGLFAAKLELRTPCSVFITEKAEVVSLRDGPFDIQGGGLGFF